jgi:hypothetical protein
VKKKKETAHVPSSTLQPKTVASFSIFRFVFVVWREFRLLCAILSFCAWGVM